MRLLKFIIFLTLTLILTTCRKKTSIKAILFNPALNEYVSNATIVLVEKHGESSGGIFSSSAGCKELASMTTDNSGVALFDKEKLKIRNSFKYFCAVKESWGVTQFYPCGGKTSNFIEKGGNHEFLVMDYVETNFNIQFNNVFTPGVAGDSLSCTLEQCKYYDPVAGIYQGGGIVGGLNITYNSNFPFPSPSTSGPTKIFANRLIIKTKKRKLGIVSSTIDTIKAYPNQLTTVQINW